MLEPRIRHIENNIYQWRFALLNRAAGVGFFRVYLIDEEWRDLGVICMWARVQNECFESMHREILEQCRDTLHFRLELDTEGAYCVSFNGLGDPYAFVMEKAHENNLEIVNMVATDSCIRVVCVSNKTTPWEILEDGLVRRGLFLKDFGFDQYDRVVVTCGKSKK